MVDHLAMHDAMMRATHPDDCGCALQTRIARLRAGMNVEDWTPAMTDLFARIEALEGALDEVGNALASIIGNNEREWDVRFHEEGTAVLLDLACETFERQRWHLSQ